MKFVSAFLAVFVFGALAQTPSAPVVIKGECGIVTGLHFSPNGGELARFCFGGPVALFDTTSYRKARTFLTEMEHTPELRQLGYSPDGTMIVTVQGYDGAQVWDAADPGKPIPKEDFVLDKLYALDTPLRILQAPSRRDSNLDVLGAMFSPDGKLLITTLGNGHMKVWNTSSWTVEKELLVTDSRSSELGFSPDGKLLITMLENGHVKIWNTSSWAVEGELIVTNSHLMGAAFAPDSQTVMIGDKNGVLHHWSLATKAEIRTLRTFEGVGILSNVTFSPDGNTLVATYAPPKPNAVTIWNTTDWIAQTESGYNSAAFSNDGKLLALGGHSHIELIEPASRKKIRDIELPEMTRGEIRCEDKNDPDAKEKIPCLVLALAFSPDGNTLAAGCIDGTVRLVKMTP